MCFFFGQSVPLWVYENGEFDDSLVMTDLLAGI